MIFLQADMPVLCVMQQIPIENNCADWSVISCYILYRTTILLSVVNILSVADAYKIVFPYNEYIVAT